MLADKSTAELVRIVGFGGGLDFNASGKTQQELVQIAGFAANKGCRVIMRGIGHKLTDELVQIAGFGKGSVVFAD